MQGRRSDCQALQPVRLPYKRLGVSIALMAFNPCHSERSEESLIFSMSSAPFEITVSVMPGDIDEQNHVNNTVYLRWVQEVATAHWRATADVGSTGEHRLGRVAA